MFYVFLCLILSPYLLMSFSKMFKTTQVSSTLVKQLCIYQLSSSEIQEVNFNGIFGIPLDRLFDIWKLVLLTREKFVRLKRLRSIQLFNVVIWRIFSSYPICQTFFLANVTFPNLLSFKWFSLFAWIWSLVLNYINYLDNIFNPWATTRLV